MTMGKTNHLYFMCYQYGMAKEKSLKLPILDDIGDFWLNSTMVPHYNRITKVETLEVFSSNPLLWIV